MTIFASLRPIAVSISVICFIACNHAPEKTGVAADSPAERKRGADLPPIKYNPEERSVVRKEPVAEYKVRTPDKLNEQYFLVRMYETRKTMRYRVTMEYEGLEGEDTVKLPDLGTPPRPELQEGKEPYSCILGLIDNEKKFRELKKIYVTPDHESLTITTLRHYVVSAGYRLVEQ